MAASYPGATYSPRTKENKAGVVYDAAKKTIGYVEDVTKLDDEVVAVETELGTNPKGAKADVKTRLDDVDTSIAAKMANPMTSPGDIIKGGTAGAPERLAKGNDAQRLTLESGVPAWADDKVAIVFIIDGGGSAITTGEKGHLKIPFPCEIEKAMLLADQSGSIVIDIWKDTYANFPPTNADSITASAPPTISAAQKAQDDTLTGWTKPIAGGSILAFNVDSCSTIERVTLTLRVKKT